MERLASYCPVVSCHRWHCPLWYPGSRRPHQECLSPCAKRRFQHVPVDPAQDCMECRRTRRLAGKAQRPYEVRSIVASPLDDHRITPIATQHGATRQR
jgi:hypothetical protein